MNPHTEEQWKRSEGSRKEAMWRITSRGWQSKRDMFAMISREEEVHSNHNHNLTLHSTQGRCTQALLHTQKKEPPLNE